MKEKLTMYGDRGNIEIAALWIVFGLLVNAVIDGWYLSLNKPDFDVVCKADSVCVIESKSQNINKGIYEKSGNDYHEERWQEDSGPHDMKKPVPPEWELKDLTSPEWCFPSQYKTVPVDCQWGIEQTFGF